MYLSVPLNMTSSVHMHMCGCVSMYHTVGVDVKNTFTPSYENNLTIDNKVTNYGYVLLMR